MFNALLKKDTKITDKLWSKVFYSNYIYRYECLGVMLTPWLQDQNKPFSHSFFKHANIFIKI